MRKPPCLAAAAILAGALLIGPAAQARGGGAGGMLGARGFAAFARQARFGAFRGNPGAFRAPLASGRTLRGGVPGAALSVHQAAAAGARFRGPFGYGTGAYGAGGFGTVGYGTGGFGYASRGFGWWSGRGLPWGWGWGSLGAGWWAAGWNFPWDWAGPAGPCYQWVYPPAAQPYCAPPYPGDL